MTNIVKKRKLLSCLIILSMILVGFIGFTIFNDVGNDANAAAATTRYVGGTGGGNYSTIQDAINASSAGDTIRVYAGIYYENIKVNRTVTMIGNGTGKTIINGSRQYDVVNISANSVVFTGFTIQYSGNTTWPTIEAGIKLYYVKYVHIHDVNCSNNYVGILFDHSSENIIEYNIIGWNDAIGILMMTADKNYIRNNICNYNQYNAIFARMSNHVEILNNTCNWNNGYSIELDSSNYARVVNNTCTNNEDGMDVWISHWLYIANNTFSSNLWWGFYCWEVDSSVFFNNTCNNNLFDDGMYISDSDSNNIYNNTCNSNGGDGLNLYFSSTNSVYNNNFSNNDNGIWLEDESDDNDIYDNYISSNTNVGIEIGWWSDNNDIYHNMILSNMRQAQDASSNNWDHDGEGNYWDDYTGLDNGAGGRIAGDGIGDTNIPHPTAGFDDYPFIKPYGWLHPGRPILKVAADVDHDGNFTVSWNFNPRVTGYTLEEDTTETFDDPLVYNTGWSLVGTEYVFDAENRTEETYYYRLQAFNDFSISDWSDVVNVTVDHLPEIPQNFQVSVYAGGNVLNLSWDLNLEDTKKYELSFRTGGGVEWQLLDNISHPVHSYNHTDLDDGDVYYYQLRSFDARGQPSAFTDIVVGVPKDTLPPAVPTGLAAEALSDSEIKLTWTANTEPDVEGYAIYMDSIPKPRQDDFQLIYTATAQETSHTITSLTEQVTYFFKMLTFDEVPNNSSFSEIVTATPPDETHPDAPTDLVVFNATHESLTLSWIPGSDTDVVGYLIFRSGSLTGEYENITADPVVGTSYTDSGLDENTVYYYKVRAVDDAELISLLSEPAYGVTLIGLKPPEINNSINDFDLREDNIDDMSINLYYLFKDANNDPLTFWCDGQDHLNVTIDPQTGAVTLIPDKDWNGKETLTFYASDGVFMVSAQFTINVTVTPVNDPPVWARIHEPEDDLEIKEGKKITLRGEGFDPDVQYGDKLTYVWSSSITGEFDDRLENLTDVKLEFGEHVITLVVSDKYGKTASTSINVTVKAKGTGAQDNGIGSSLGVIIGAVVVVIVVILLLLFFLVFKKKKPPADDVDKDLPEVKPVMGAQYPGAFTPPIQGIYGYGPGPGQMQATVHQPMPIPQTASGQPPEQTLLAPDQYQLSEGVQSVPQLPPTH